MRIRLVSNLIILAFALLFAACATSETRSVVDTGSVGASKYKKIAVFVENLDYDDRIAAEQIVASALRNSGIEALSGPDVFKGRRSLTGKEKADLVQKDFDAVLYVAVVDKGITEELIPNAYFDGQSIHRNVFGIDVSSNINPGYVLKPDGSVYQAKFALKTKSDLQDTKSAKPVWSAETIAVGEPLLSNMTVVFTEAAKQITEKMRADQAI